MAQEGPVRRYLVLGPLEVDVSGQVTGWRRLANGKVELLLALLLVSADRRPDEASQPKDTLRRWLWEDGDVDPARLRQTVSHLKAVIGEDTVSAGGPTVTLHLAGAEVDVDVFRRLRDRGAGDLRGRRFHAALEALDPAVDLWRSPRSFDGIDHRVINRFRDRLAAERLDALLARAEALIELGRHGDALATLEPIAEDGGVPDNQNLVALTARALHLVGRPDDGVRRCRVAGRKLAASGKPHDRVDGMARQILARDPALMPAAPPVPSRLPAVPTPFVGRTREVAALLADLRSAAGDPGGGVVLVLSGPAGVGKTAVAAAAARAAADAFPAGVHYHDLREEAAAGSWGLTLERMLADFGYAGRDLPADTAARLELFHRSLGRSTEPRLLVLDNAAGAEQVRPLLPPRAPGCVVLVVSRVAMASLEPRRHEVERLSVADGVVLLTEVAGRGIGKAGAASAERIVRTCDCLPLVIRPVAAMISADRRTLAAHARALAEPGVIARQVTRSGTVGQILLASARSLPADVRAALFALGALDVPTFSAWTAAVVLSRRPDEAATALRQLVDAELLTIDRVDELGRQRYALHALVRDATRQDPDAPDARATVDRLLRALIAVGEEFTEQLEPTGHRPPMLPIQQLVPRERLTAPARQRQPAAWQRSERGTVLAVVHQAVALGQADVAWRLPVATKALFELVGDLTEWEQATDIALDAVRAWSGGVRPEPRGDDDLLPEAWLLLTSGALRRYQNLWRDSTKEYERAAALFTRAGDSWGRVRALWGVGDSWLGRDSRGTEHLDTAERWLKDGLELARSLGDRRGEASALASLGEIEGLRAQVADEVEETITRFERSAASIDEAMVIFEELGDDRARSDLLRDVGTIRQASCGLPGVDAVAAREEAVRLFRRSLRLAVAVGDRPLEGRASASLGHALGDSGDLREAMSRLQAARSLFRQLGDRRWLAIATAFLGIETGKTEPAAGRTMLDDAVAVLEDLGQHALASRFRSARDAM